MVSQKERIADVLLDFGGRPGTLQGDRASLSIGRRRLDLSRGARNKLVGKPDEYEYTLGEVSGLYLAYGKTKTGEDKADTTRELDAQLVRDYVLPPFGDRVAMKIEPLEIQNSINALTKGIRSKVRNLMSAIYRHGQIFGKIPRREECNPMRWVSASSTSDYEAVVITPEQAWAIAANLPLYERTLVITNAATGCRISECLGFKWLDIEWEKTKSMSAAGGRGAKSEDRSRRRRRLRSRCTRFLPQFFKLGGRKVPTRSLKVGCFPA